MPKIDPDSLFSTGDLEKMRSELDKKVHLTSSEDGLVSMQYTASGNYKSLSINGDLSTMDKEVIEKDIIDLINYSKNQMSADFTEYMMKNMKEEKAGENEVEESEEDEEDDTEVRHDVS